VEREHLQTTLRSQARQGVSDTDRIEWINVVTKIFDYRSKCQSRYSPLMNATLATTGLRWTARLLALLIAGFVLLMAIGEGFSPAKLKSSELALAVPFFVAWVGMVLGWRWEGLGGTLVVAGILGFYLVHFATTGFGRFPRGWFFPTLTLPGILFLACWFLRRSASAVPTPQ
jgi:hypothetical protein